MSYIHSTQIKLPHVVNFTHLVFRPHTSPVKLALLENQLGGKAAKLAFATDGSGRAQTRLFGRHVRNLLESVHTVGCAQLLTTKKPSLLLKWPAVDTPKNQNSTDSFQDAALTPLQMLSNYNS